MASKKIRIIIADDEVHARKYIRTIMERMDCEIVAEVADGDAAVKRYFELKPHMLLLDINMPASSGKTALQTIIRRAPNAFIIMLTSLVDKETIEDCIDMGASGYIRKDVPVEEIRSLIVRSWRLYKEARKRQ